MKERERERKKKFLIHYPTIVGRRRPSRNEFRRFSVNIKKLIMIDRFFVVIVIVVVAGAVVAVAVVAVGNDDVEPDVLKVVVVVAVFAVADAVA